MKTIVYVVKTLANVVKITFDIIEMSNEEDGND